jgi:HK97 family phage prohead protease
MKIKLAPIRVKAGEEGQGEGVFEAYASTFTREPDSYGDVVAKGAFATTLKEWAESGNVLPVLYGHRMDDPDFNIGGVTEAIEDDHGLKVTVALDLDNPKAAQVYRLIKGKRVNQMSFAFDVLDEGTVEEDGRKFNELREVKLYEVSVVPVGANQDTEILAVKAAVDALTDGIKSGRVLSAKNEKAIDAAVEQISGAADRLKTILAAVRGGDEENDQEKASGQGAANDEEPQRAKSEEPAINPSVEALALTEKLYALNVQEGVQE